MIKKPFLKPKMMYIFLTIVLSFLISCKQKTNVKPKNNNTEANYSYSKKAVSRDALIFNLYPNMGDIEFEKALGKEPFYHNRLHINIEKELDFEIIKNKHNIQFKYESSVIVNSKVNREREDDFIKWKNTEFKMLQVLKKELENSYSQFSNDLTKKIESSKDHELFLLSSLKEQIFLKEFSMEKNNNFLFYRDSVKTLLVSHPYYSKQNILKIRSDKRNNSSGLLKTFKNLQLNKEKKDKESYDINMLYGTNFSPGYDVNHTISLYYFFNEDFDNLSKETLRQILKLENEAVRKDSLINGKIKRKNDVIKENVNLL